VTYTYAGLKAALVAEAASRTPLTRPGPGGSGLAFGIAVGAATMLVMGPGSWLITRRREKALAAFKA